MSIDHGTRTLVPPRRLSENERQVLHTLSGTVEAPPEVLACQADHALVVEECAIRCGTVILAVEEGACPPVDIMRGAPAAADAKGRTGNPVSVLLHFRDGYIRMLEMVRFGDEKSTDLPPNAELVAYGTKSRSEGDELAH